MGCSLDDFEKAQIFYENNKNNKSFKIVLATEIAKTIIVIEKEKMTRKQK